MLTQQAIHDFFEQSDYDIRKSGNGRWIDQKCTADVVTIISDFIYDYVANHPAVVSVLLISGTPNMQARP